MGVDMFPFLSVLCSVIGVLMLFMMIVISTRVIEADEAPPPPELEAGDLGVEEGIDAKTYERLEREINDKSALLSARILERDRLRQKYRELRELIEEKRDLLVKKPVPERKPNELSLPEKVQLAPLNPGEVNRDPIFIEVKIEGYLVQPEKVLYPAIERVRDGRSLSDVQLRVDPRLEAFLNQQEKRDELLVFLIHPNGTDAFQNMELHILKNHSRIVKIGGGLAKREPKFLFGKEPFSSGWEFIRHKP